MSVERDGERAVGVESSRSSSSSLNGKHLASASFSRFVQVAICSNVASSLMLTLLRLRDRILGQ